MCGSKRNLQNCKAWSYRGLATLFTHVTTIHYVSTAAWQYSQVARAVFMICMGTINRCKNTIHHCTDTIHPLRRHYSLLRGHCSSIARTPFPIVRTLFIRCADTDHLLCRHYSSVVRTLFIRCTDNVHPLHRQCSPVQRSLPNTLLNSIPSNEEWEGVFIGSQDLK